MPSSFIYDLGLLHVKNKNKKITHAGLVTRTCLFGTIYPMPTRYNIDYVVSRLLIVHANSARFLHVSVLFQPIIKRVV